MKYFQTILVFFLFYSSIQAQFTQNDGYYYKDGQLFSGIYEQYNESGQLTARLSLKNGLPDGISELYKDGILYEKRSFSKGSRNGIWETYENNSKVSEAWYKKDKKHGKWLIWDSSGNLRYEMYYKKGKKTGVWKMWDENGVLISEKKY